MMVTRGALCASVAFALISIGGAAYAVEASLGQRAVDAAIGTQEAGERVAEMRDALFQYRSSELLFAQPVFDSDAWKAYVATAERESEAYDEHVRVSSARKLDSVVLIPSLNQRFKDEVEIGLGLRPTGSDEARLDAILSGGLACSAHQDGSSDAEASAQVSEDFPEPFFAEIAAYSISVCPEAD